MAEQLRFRLRSGVELWIQYTETAIIDGEEFPIPEGLRLAIPESLPGHVVVRTQKQERSHQISRDGRSRQWTLDQDERSPNQPMQLGWTRKTVRDRG
jgi:hypothetical protein